MYLETKIAGMEAAQKAKVIMYLEEFGYDFHTEGNTAIVVRGPSDQNLLDFIEDNA